MARSLYGQLSRYFRTSTERYSRREFLAGSLAVSAGLMTGCVSGSSRYGRGVGEGRRVIVVGAGLSGLACAYELRSVGYEVTVVEARRRLGGRVLTLNGFVPGKTVEAGGELIGRNHPLWRAYAGRFNLELLKLSDDEGLEPTVWIEGRRLSLREARELFEEMENGHHKLNTVASAIDAEEPWNSPNAAALDSGSMEDSIRTLDLSPRGRAAMTNDFENTNGVSIGRQSFLANLAQIKGGGLDRYWEDSETHRCRGGNDQLARKFAEGFGPDRIRFDTPVDGVEWSSGSVAVRCADGNRIEAEDVVVTVPPSCWPKIQFEPALPAPLANLQMGTNIKYLVGLKEPIWKAQKQSPNATTDTALGVTWEGTDRQPGPGVGLTLFAGGPAAEKARVLWNAEGEKAFRRQLDQIFAGFEAAFVTGRFIDWPSDRWTQAGYSFPSPGQLTSVGAILQDGLGRLHFAGEHTCPKFVGYMEGALQSGAAVARRLARRDGAKAML